MTDDGWLRDPLLARAAWSRLAEPGDPVAGALLTALGPVEALGWLRHALEGAPLTLDAVTALDTSSADDVERPLGDGVARAGAAPGAPARLGAELSPEATRRLARAAERWAGRWKGLDPRRELRVLHRLGGTLLVPEEPGWPVTLGDLGACAPPCLWVRGTADLEALLARSVAVVGARASTGYGEHVTSGIVAGVAARGWTVVSGGAYGIDAAAHRAALAAGGPTVAFLAGGVDRLYPAGNSRLLEEVVAAGGAVVSEVPPGSVPSRSRFLQRNRLIAAGSRAAVVVEAAWRSGALSTAAHAARLLRPVGAVPGPVTSASSAGCHRLLREGTAVCVTDADEVLELAGPAGEQLAAAPVLPVRPEDGLSIEERRTLDALPVHRPARVESVARAAGMTIGEVRGALGTLELAGLATGGPAGWRRQDQTKQNAANRTYHHKSPQVYPN